MYFCHCYKTKTLFCVCLFASSDLKNLKNFKQINERIYSVVKEMLTARTTYLPPTPPYWKELHEWKC